ncbi:putative Amastin surface glycoprotein [Leishmania utingensis]|uniref:Amastin surface glycoprotein n=1 Tax=Leishmania utingensis TaxID=653362 RepID=A0AAW3B2I5_9TRYP
MEFTLVFLLYAVLQFIAFLFVLVATPLDMLYDKNGSRFDNRPCVTLWGAKDECYGLTYEMTSDEAWNVCPVRRNRFRAAQAFAIISIFVYGLAAVLGFILLWCCSHLRFVCLALNVTGIVTVGFVWASILVTYYKTEFPCLRENLYTVLGSGFVLLVMAWCLDIINIVLLLLSWQAAHPSESVETKE